MCEFFYSTRNTWFYNGREFIKGFLGLFVSPVYLIHQKLIPYHCHNCGELLQQQIEQRLFKGKAVVLYGARQTGKTTLVKMIQENYQRSLYLNCDEPDIRERLTNASSTELAAFLGRHTLIVIDEAQRVENIGLTIKLLVDTLGDKQIIATGSSSFELSDKIKESLTGRAFEFHLYPLSLEELTSEYNAIELNRILEQRMIYGMYPEVVVHHNHELLKVLADSYLYKDILMYQSIKSHEVLIKLLQALALQIGREVSYNELAATVGIDKKTVDSYIRILEQAFIVFRLQPFSRNLRTELKKLRKIYFCDVGIRNALINNFNPLNVRQDTGALFENFVITERIKYTSNHLRTVNRYFWRTHQQKEIDYIEDVSGVLNAYEIKYGAKRTAAPRDFVSAYPNSSYTVITKDKVLPFVCGESA